MIYRINAARLLVSTYGEPFDPAMRQPLHVLAENLDQSDAIQRTLDRCRQDWLSSDTLSPTMAMAQARQALEGSLEESDMEGAWALLDTEVAYRPVFDKTGVQVAHDTIVWLTKDQGVIVKEFKTSTNNVELGLVGCIFLSIGHTT